MAKKLKVWWSGDVVGSGGFELIDITGNETDEQLEEMARDEAFEHISWGHAVIDEEDNEDEDDE